MKTSEILAERLARIPGAADDPAKIPLTDEQLIESVQGLEADREQRSNEMADVETELKAVKDALSMEEKQADDWAKRFHQHRDALVKFYDAAVAAGVEVPSEIALLVSDAVRNIKK